MNKDLKIIKKKYGEKMSNWCRKQFPSILEEEGLLSKLLLDNFNESHSLYNDIIENNLESKFKQFIYSKIYTENNNQIKITKTPTELMNEAGYILNECKTEEDIQQFRKYYEKNEQLCTFRENRLKKCHVFFAVRKNVNEIKREDFPEPERQDEYGTSVISIQFTKDKSHTLSIKNRYNHTVNNPDATFSNNLDNIIEDLTDSFANHYGLIQKASKTNFEIPNYVRANDGKYYKYNYETYNTYYCPDNIIIHNFEVKKYDKSKYLIIDYFIIDLVNKKINTYNKTINDYFTYCFNDLSKIEIKKTNSGKQLKFINQENKVIEVSINKDNIITSFSSDDIEEIGRGFLRYNEKLSSINLPNLKYVLEDFLTFNKSLTSLKLDNLEIVTSNFLPMNEVLKIVYFPKLRKVGHEFLSKVSNIEKLILPNVESIGHDFLVYNNSLKILYTPNLESVGVNFLASNKVLKKFAMPNLTSIKKGFLNSHSYKIFIEHQIKQGREKGVNK